MASKLAIPIPTDPRKAAAVERAALAALRQHHPREYVQYRLSQRYDGSPDVLQYRRHDAGGSGGQIAFKNLVAREKYAFSGWRGGKSIEGANSLLDDIAARAFHYGEAIPETRYAIVAPTWSDVEPIVDFSFLPYIPPDIIKKQSKSGPDPKIELIDGVNIFLRSTENPDRLQSLGDLDFIWADEIGKMSEVAHLSLQGRLTRRKGLLIGTTTPLKWQGQGQTKRISWLYEMLQQEEVIYSPGEQGVFVGKGGDVAAVVWGAGASPYFDPAEEQRLREKWDAVNPAWAAQWLDAGFVDLIAGQVFKREWFRPADEIPELDVIVISVDPASGEKTISDFTAILVGGYSARTDTYYVIDEIRAHLAFPDQKIALTNLSTRFRIAAEIAVEDVGYQKSLIQELKRECQEGRCKVYPRGDVPIGDKTSRALPEAAVMAAGRVLFSPRLLTNDFIAEFEAFPAGPRDDRIDAYSLLLRRLRRLVEGSLKLDIKVEGVGRREAWG